jgi:hypothetical protein
MSEVVSGENLTVIVLNEDEVDALVGCLRTIDAAAKLGDDVEFEQDLCNRLTSLFDALGA